MQNIVYRQRVLLEILGSEQIYSQEQLLQKLRERGISSTQATLSRDLKALNIIKVPGVGYRIHSSGPAAVPASAPRGILSIEFSGVNAVIRTQPGFAPAVASHIDHHPSRPVMGTLAGDDTVLLVLRQGFTEEECLSALEKNIPGIINLLIK